MKRNLLILAPNLSDYEGMVNRITARNKNVTVHYAPDISGAYFLCMCHEMDVIVLEDDGQTYETNQNGTTISFMCNLRKIPHYQFTPMIMITPYEDMEFSAFHILHCYDFFTDKSEKKLESAVNQALNYKTSKFIEKTILMKKEGIIFLYPVEDIIYVENKNHRVWLHFKESKTDFPYETMKELQNKFTKQDFLQCSRSVLVNKRYILAIDKGNKFIRLRNGDHSIGITQAFYEDIIQELAYKKS